VVEETTNDGQAENVLGDGELMEELDFASIDAFFNNQSFVDQALTGADFPATTSIEPPNPAPLMTRSDLIQ